MSDAVQAAQPTDAIPMSFRDGSTAMVPKAKVSDAMLDDGAQLLHPVKFPDGSNAWVKHSDLASAFHDGGKRMDSQPEQPMGWKQAMGLAWGTITGSSMPSADVGGRKDLGQEVTQGLTEMTGGHPVKGALRTAGAVAEGVSPALGVVGAPEAALPEKVTAETASKLPDELRTITAIYKETEAAAMNAETKITSVGYKEMSETAQRKAAEAAQLGNQVDHVKYSAAAVAFKGYSKWEGAWNWVAENYPWAPGVIKAAVFLDVASKGIEGATWAVQKVTGTGEPDAQ